MNVFDLPRQQSAGSRVFYVTRAPAGAPFYTFLRPHGASWLYGILIGGGASGVGRNTAASQGGGGGGSGAITRFFVPFAGLPDVLFLNVGNGGAIATNTTANGGNPTILSTGNSSSPSFVLARADGGQSGSTSTGGAGAAAVSTGVFNTIGQVVIVDGQAGGNGTGNDNPGDNVTWGAAGLPLSGGAGGAGRSTTGAAGGSVIVPTGYPAITGGALGGNAGGHGYQIFKPFMGFGGAGGGSNVSGVGGRGGDAVGFGCGGGGAGGGTSNGAWGGRGGDGLAMLWWW